MPDPYEIIGVRRDASLDEIRIAYRRSAQVLHPDRFATSSDGVRSEAARRMLQLNSAMEAIEEERADEASGTGTLGSTPFGTRGSAPGSRAPAATPPRPAHSTTAAPSNGTPPPAPSVIPPAPPRVELPRPSIAPASTPTPQPVAAEAAVATPGRELAAYVSTPLSQSTSAPAAAPPTPAPEPEPEPARPYSLHTDHAFSFEDDDTDYDDELPPVKRRPVSRGGRRSVLPAVIAGIVIIVALVVIAAYFVFGRSSGTGEQTFTRASAPFTFTFPKDFHERRLDGGIALNKPTYQVGFGLDESNYLLVSTYKLGFTVQDDGSATGPKGQQLTPDQINHDIDVTIAKLASQAGFTQNGVESGSLGSLRARIFDYSKPDGSLSSTFVVALSGTTEYYVTCQSSPHGQKRIAAACARLLTTFSSA